MKPREWWVLVFSFMRTPGGNGRYEAFDYKLSSEDAVHVIEKSAYDSVLAKLIEVDKLIEGIWSGRELGTNWKRAGENAKMFAHQIHLEIAAFRKKLDSINESKPEGE